jgi:hypothetical protein
MAIQIFQSRHKGSSLVIVVITMVLSLLIGGALLQLGYGSRVLAVQRTGETMARCAADAGIEKGLAYRNLHLKDVTFTDPAISEPLPNCDASYVISYPDPNGNGYVLRSVGTATNRNASRTVTTVLRLKGLYEFGLFADESIRMNNFSGVSVWNNGAPEPTLQIATNASGVDINAGKNGATLEGDFYLGYGSTPTGVGNIPASQVNTLPAPIVLDPVVLPASLVAAALSANIAATGTVGPGVYKCKTLNIGGGAGAEVLTISGAVEMQVTDTITIGNSGLIVLEPGASLALYIGGGATNATATFKNSSTMGSDPTRFKIYGLSNCTKITTDNSGAIYAAIYAPDTDITLKNSGGLYGAVVGQSITLDNSAHVYYDAYLKNTTIFDVGAKFVIRSWQED